MRVSSVLLGILVFVPLVAARAAEPFPGAKAHHQGLAIYSVPVGDDKASVLVPDRPAAGRPWVLVGSLYKLDSPPVANMARTELELVRRGFHVVAFGLGNTFGAPDAVAKWDAVYREMTGKYGLGRKPVLMGLSREGLPIVRWAAANPDKVTCLYLDKAVCDYRSWPGAKLGQGRGSLRDWQSLIRLYGFKDEAEAMASDRNPVNLVPTLAAARIPIIYVAGETDDAVPFAENGARIEQQYKAAGATFRLILHKGEGHHPHGLADPYPVADFVQIYTTGWPAPTVVDAAYGPHPKQVLHFWKAKSERPTPLLYYIHGGSWMGGNRTFVGEQLQAMLKNGISVVSIEYRFIQDAAAEKIVPSVKAPLSDAARALQFVRSKAAEWNLDKTRVAVSGNSAGACSSLWLAFHPDLADPNSNDPVARQLTRVRCAAVGGAQTTLDPQQMHQWTPNSVYGGHAFDFHANKENKWSPFEEFLANREKILPWIAEYSPYALVTADDPPVYLAYSTPPALGQAEKDPTHTANFGVKLQERCRAVGVECEVAYPGASGLKHKGINEFLFDKLK
jgi:acetyl esterase/lipase